MSSQTTTKQRQSGIELLKIIAMFAIRSGRNIRNIKYLSTDKQRVCVYYADAQLLGAVGKCCIYYKFGMVFDRQQ